MTSTPYCLAIFFLGDEAPKLPCFCGYPSEEPHVHCPNGPAPHVHFLNDPDLAAQYEEAAMR